MLLAYHTEHNPHQLKNLTARTVASPPSILAVLLLVTAPKAVTHSDTGVQTVDGVYIHVTVPGAHRQQAQLLQ